MKISMIRSILKKSLRLVIWSILNHKNINCRVCPGARVINFLPAIMDLFLFFFSRLLPQETLGSSVQATSHLPPLDRHGDFYFEPEKVLQRSLIKVNHKLVVELLIKWKYKGTPDEEATWVPNESPCLDQFPDLVGKVF